MELTKRKYSAKEVEKLIQEQSEVYEQKLSSQKETINELKEDKEKTTAELNRIKSMEALINATLLHAQKDAESMRKKADLNYTLAMGKLRKFSERWTEYFKLLKEKYPLYPFVNESVELFNKLKELLNGKKPEEAIKQLDKELKEKEALAPFNPKDKMKDYVAAASDNGFNIEEVLNPGKLELEDICKELGLIEE